MGFFERYQHFFGFCALGLLLSGTILLVNRSPAALAAPNDVRGSANVAVAALPAKQGDNQVVCVVKADGSIASIPVPAGLTFPSGGAGKGFNGICGALTANGGAYFASVTGDDGKIYIYQLEGANTGLQGAITSAGFLGRPFTLTRPWYIIDPGQ